MEEGKEESKEDGTAQYNKPGYWLRWLQAAKRSSETHRNESKAAWAEYKNRALREADGVGKSTRLYPIYHSSCKVLEPALYALTPELLARRRFGANDDIARLASTIEEDLGEYLVDKFDFDGAMMGAVSDFIHADKATLQLIYKTELKDIPIKIPLSQGEGESFIGPDGMPFDGEVFSDETGFYGQTIKQKAVNQEIYVSPIRYEDILHTPEAKTQSEIVDIAYKFSMRREEAELRFKDKLTNVSWITKKNDDGADIPGEFLEGYEIYCKASKKCYWITEQKNDDFLDVKDDPYGLEGFFPSPDFIIGSKPDDSLYPTPLYQQCKPILDQLHMMVGRVFRLITSVRRRALVDGANDDLINALNNLEGQEFIACENFRLILEKGGVANLVQYIEVQDLVNAIRELVELEETFKNWFFEWFGVPDILRGSSEPIETAKAQEIKQQAANDRFKYMKKQVAQLARDSIRMMVDLALKVFDDEKMMAVCGYQYKTPEQQAIFPQALELLRNDHERCIRLDIDSNTLTFYDRELKKQQNVELVTTVTQGLEKVSGMLQNGGPPYANVGLKLLMGALDALEGGEEYMEEVKQSIEALIASNEQQSQEPPPPSDKQIQAQVDQQKIEAQERMNTVEFQFKMQELQLTQAAKMEELRLTGIQLGVETQLAQMDTQLKALQTQIDQYRVVNEAKEKIIEEMRLGQEKRDSDVKEATEGSKQQPIVINNIIPPKVPVSLVTETIRDANGTLVGAKSVPIPEEPEVQI